MAKRIINTIGMEVPSNSCREVAKTLIFNAADNKDSDEDSVKERRGDREFVSAKVQKKHQAIRNIRGLSGSKSVAKGIGMTRSLSR